MSTHTLFKSGANWDLSSLPAEIQTWAPRSKDTSVFSKFHDPSVVYSGLNAFVTMAALGYITDSMACVRVANGCFATERQLANTTQIFQLTETGSCSGCIIDDVSGQYKNLPVLGNKSDTTDLSFIMLAVMMRVCEEDSATSDMLLSAKANYDENNLAAIETELRYLSDAVYYAVNSTNPAVKVTITGGNINFFTKQKLDIIGVNGTLLCGAPKYLNKGQGGKRGKKTNMTFAAVKKDFEFWTKNLSWTQEEESLIPTFPDDFPVMPEVVLLCNRFTQTHGDRRPMLNFLWRGITSYGKSTGVELMAAILHTPLVKMTCHTSMERQEFLSDFVPCGNSDHICEELPSADDILFDPEGAYERMTGEAKEGVTPNDCLKAYADCVAAKASKTRDQQRFKMVEANFVRGLAKGYIVEVQEISRIKDSGVLVGLNEYDHPGALIPLVNGGFVKRHPNACVVYTDNVGYVSCRPVDPSVLRRMAFIIDSYELPKEDVIARVVYNTGFEDKDLLDEMYKVWEKTKEFCEDRDITEGSISVTELEMWAQAVKADGYSNVVENAKTCLVSKATSVIEEQKEIISSVLAVHLGA